MVQYAVKSVAHKFSLKETLLADRHKIKKLQYWENITYEFLSYLPAHYLCHREHFKSMFFEAFLVTHKFQVLGNLLFGKSNSFAKSWGVRFWALGPRKSTELVDFAGKIHFTQFYFLIFTVMSKH